MSTEQQGRFKTDQRLHLRQHRRGSLVAESARGLGNQTAIPSWVAAIPLLHGVWHHVEQQRQNQHRQGQTIQLPAVGITPAAVMTDMSRQPLGAANGQTTSETACMRQRNRHSKQPQGVGRRLPFASLTTSIDFRRSDSRLRQTFDEMDTDGKGFLVRADLHAYARREGLPEAFIPAFMDAVLTGSGCRNRGGGTSTSSSYCGVGGRAGSNAADEQLISFEAFQAFQRSREPGLRATFNSLDTDGSGTLDASELSAALTAVQPQLPARLPPQCVESCRQKAVDELLDRAAQHGRQSGLSFGEFRSLLLFLPAQQALGDYLLTSQCGGGLCDVGGCISIHDHVPKASPWRHLLAGALAGAASRTATAPLETLRLQAMTGAATHRNTLAAGRQLVTDAGWRALYRGNGTNVLRSAPQKALDFFAFDLFKGLLGAGSGGGNGRVFAAAGLAGCTSNALLYPLEVVRTRLTASGGTPYAGVRDAFRKIVATEGVAGLYRGLLPSVAAMLPEAAITYGMFDLLKSRHRAVTGQEAGVPHVLAFGVSASFMGQLVAFPLEAVSRRLQMECGSNFASLTARIIREEGPLALYRGVGAASLRVVPMACVSFGVYAVVANGGNDTSSKGVKDSQ